MAGGLIQGAWVRELEIDGAVTLFHTELRTALVLNETASDVWRLIDGVRGVDEIVAQLMLAYDVDADTARAGVEDALAQFREHELLDTAE